MKFTKDKMLELLLENQKVISDQVERNIVAFNNMQSALHEINESNRLHNEKDTERDTTLKSLIESNNKFYKVFTYILLITILALVVLAGAEKVLKFLPGKVL